MAAQSGMEKTRLTATTQSSKHFRMLWCEDLQKNVVKARLTATITKEIGKSTVRAGANISGQL